MSAGTLSLHRACLLYWAPECSMVRIKGSEVQYMLLVKGELNKTSVFGLHGQFQIGLMVHWNHAAWVMIRY